MFTPSSVFPDEPASPELLEDPAVTDPATASSIDPPPEPVTLARRIQALLSRSPAVSDTPAHETADGTTSESATYPPALVSDAKLVTLLSSPAVMNGTLSKSGQSVWSVLDRLRSQLPGQSTSSRIAAAANEGDGRGREDGVLEDDDSGVMIYGPLIPNDDSQVELARSEDVADDGESGKAAKPPLSAKPDTLESLKGKLEEMWPFKGKEDGKQATDGDTTPSTTRVHFQPVQPGRPKRVWVPSPDKISIQVMWWGYRMYV